MQYKLVIFLIIPIISLTADIVTMKNGSAEADVKTYIKQKSIEVHFRNGTIRIFNKAEIKGVKFLKVEWKTVNSNVTEENEWKRIAEEQKRFNELLQAEIDEIKSQALPKYTSNNILISSLLLPGFGQYKNGRILKGALFSGSFILSLFFIGIEYQKFTATKESINQSNKSAYATILFPEQFFPFHLSNWINNEKNLNELSNTRQKINIGIGISLFVYIYNLIDAKFFSGAYKANTDKPKLSFIIQNQQDRYIPIEHYRGIELQWRF